MRRLAVLALAAAPAFAGTMTPEAFDAAATGRTLHFSLAGQPFGSEQYFSGRRVLWRFEDGSCQLGRWWPSGALICFAYDSGGGAQCWAFRPHPGGFSAALVEGGAETGFVLDLAGSDSVPLDCPGPGVGS